MNQNRLTFQSENLTIDWIGFKFQELDHDRKMKIVHYLFKLGFNSYQQSAKLSKPIKEELLVNSKNNFDVLFVQENFYWKGILLQFTGYNAKRFYFLAKQKTIDWTLFSNAILSRFDIYYSRENQKNDPISVRDFFDNSLKKLKLTNQNVGFDQNSLGLILRIGNRRSSLFSRIYQKYDQLRFEHEMKGQFIRKYSNYLMTNNFETFESKISQHFIIYFGQKLPLDSIYLDWLVMKLRPMHRRPTPNSYLNSHYIRSSNEFDSLEKRTNFFHLLQFLKYVQELDYTKGHLGSTVYRLYTFKVHDFLKYIHPNVRTTNYYQLKKLLKFLDELQKNSIIKSFSDKKFRSLVTIPELTVEKNNQNCWITEVWIAEELFYYSYPFMLPSLSQIKRNKDQFEVQFKVLEIYSSINIEKVFFINEFLKKYGPISNKRSTEIKKEFIKWIEILKEYNLIENDYKLMKNGRISSTKKLTINSISEGFILYEKISVLDLVV